MGRGRVQLKRIENKISRQVTFSKRRTGLLKKANEISLLCDADVALILFSTKGKLFEYSTHSSMEAILERYERCSYGEKLVMGPDAEITQGSWTLESSKLRTKIDLLQKNIRHYGGEDLESLNLRELQSIEQQLENALKRIRTKKNHVMHESISKLQKKERALQDRINAFSKKKQLKDDKKNNEPENAGFFLSQPSPVSPLPPQPPRDSFERTIDDSAQIHTISAPMMPSWLYHHMNQ